MVVPLSGRKLNDTLAEGVTARQSQPTTDSAFVGRIVLYAAITVNAHPRKLSRGLAAGWVAEVTAQFYRPKSRVRLHRYRLDVDQRWLPFETPEYGLR